MLNTLGAQYRIRRERPSWLPFRVGSEQMELFDRVELVNLYDTSAGDPERAIFTSSFEPERLILLGTSVSDALRTQSNFLRTRRRQESEEKAGKVGVKLVFPIFFFCLPSLFIVTAGPGILQLVKNLFPMMKQFH